MRFKPMLLYENFSQFTKLTARPMSCQAKKERQFSSFRVYRRKKVWATCYKLDWNPFLWRFISKSVVVKSLP